MTVEQLIEILKQFKPHHLIVPVPNPTFVGYATIELFPERVEDDNSYEIYDQEE